MQTLNIPVTVFALSEGCILILKVCKREITEVSEQESTGISMPWLFNFSV
jgi:hypothetical protein